MKKKVPAKKKSISKTIPKKEAKPIEVSIEEKPEVVAVDSSVTEEVPDPVEELNKRILSLTEGLVGDFSSEAWEEGEKWSEKNEVKFPLSRLVVQLCFHEFDGVNKGLLKKVPVKVPVKDENERKWAKQFISALYKWASSREKVDEENVARIVMLMGRANSGDWFVGEGLG